jgi:hypothetical protein
VDIKNREGEREKMKNNLRFILAALLLACIAALGVSHGAWAGPLAHGTVPSCPTTGTIYKRGNIVTCHALVEVKYLSRGGSVTSTEIDISSLGLPRHGKSSFGVQITLSGNNHRSFPSMLINVCFPDPTGKGIIYRYWSNPDWRTYYKSNEKGRWVVSPSFHRMQSHIGYTCTQTWLPGIYTIVY